MCPIGLELTVSLSWFDIYISTKANGYLRGSADVSVWLINGIVKSVVQFLATEPFILITVYERIR